MTEAAAFYRDLGQYPLPPPRVYNPLSLNSPFIYGSLVS